MNANGIIIKQVKYTPKDAVDLLEKVLRQNGITIYARIDQQAEALKGNVKTAPLEFLLFGNPAKGGLIMLKNPVAALDLPLKVIAWQDAAKANYVAFNDADYLQARHSLNYSLAQLTDIKILITKTLQ